LTFEPEAFSYKVKISRNLTYTGKTLIVKNLLISLCGYEIEMLGIPEKYVKEITTLVWGFCCTCLLVCAFLIFKRPV
jgi:Mg2+ and Co2+ transporter CorA